MLAAEGPAGATLDRLVVVLLTLALLALVLFVFFAGLVDLAFALAGVAFFGLIDRALGVVFLVVVLVAFLMVFVVLARRVRGLGIGTTPVDLGGTLGHGMHGPPPRGKKGRGLHRVVRKTASPGRRKNLRHPQKVRACHTRAGFGQGERPGHAEGEGK